MCGLQYLQSLIGEWWRTHHVWAAGSPEPYRGLVEDTPCVGCRISRALKGSGGGHTMCGLKDLQSLIGEWWRTYHVWTAGSPEPYRGVVEDTPYVGCRISRAI